jgi:hypothetical protein
MKITNTTKWDAEDLRRLFGRCIKEVRKIEGRGKNEGLFVKVNNASHQNISGRAFVGWYRMTIMIGKNVDFADRKWKRRLAKVFIHEYYHNLGYRSQDWNNYKRDWTENFNYDFIEEYQIREKKVEPKPVKDLQMERYQKVLKYVKMHTSKLEREKNLVKSWKKKQKYYERVLMAAGKIEKK